LAAFKLGCYQLHLGAKLRKCQLHPYFGNILKVPLDQAFVDHLWKIAPYMNEGKAMLIPSSVTPPQNRRKLSMRIRRVAGLTCNRLLLDESW